MKPVYFFLGCWLLVGFACENPSTSADHSQGSVAISMQYLDSPADSGSEVPNLLVGADSNLFMSWIEKDSAHAGKLFYAQYEQGRWSMPETIAQGTSWFINWADYPTMAVDERGNKLVTFLPMSGEGTYSYDVGLKAYPASRNGWSATQILNDDGFAGEHGFVSALPWPDSGFFVCWLDGRQGAQKGPMSLRAARLNPDLSKVREDALDLRVCDCCQTAAVWTPSGPVVFYRDRSEEEVRDIYTVRWEDEGWSEPACVYADNWQIFGCPVNGPRADAKGDHIVVAWFSMAEDSPQVKCVFSEDGGKSFSPPTMLSSKSPLGRVDAVMLDENRAAITWIEELEKEATIELAIVSRNGGILHQQQIAKTSIERASGFPQMALYQDTLFFAWTQVQQPKLITTARVPISSR